MLLLWNLSRPHVIGVHNYIEPAVLFNDSIVELDHSFELVVVQGEEKPFIGWRVCWIHLVHGDHGAVEMDFPQPESRERVREQWGWSFNGASVARLELENPIRYGEVDGPYPLLFQIRP